MASALGLAPPTIKRARKRKDNHSPTGNSHCLDLLPGSNCSWIPRYLRTISLPTVFATKKAYAEVELKIGAREKKDEQLEIIS